MRIKEVEKLTGLTAKAIRLYESKGLLNVARQTQNDYRDYTQEDVERLKTIAFLRDMDISISGIKDWADGKLTMQDLMRFTAGKAHDEAEAAKIRAELAQEALKLMEENPELDLMSAMAEIQTLRELKREIDRLVEQVRGNLFVPVLSTVVSLGPVGWTVLHILGDRSKDAIWAFALSIPMVIYAAFRWAQYFRVARNRRSKAGCLTGLLLAAFCFCFAIGLVIFVSVCQEALFVSGDLALVVFRQPWLYFILLIPIGELILGFSPAVKGSEDVKLDWKGWLVIAVFNLLLLYGGITAVSVCSPEGFVRHSFFNPFGTLYTLGDVEYVEAGFYGKGIALFTGHETGDFYYKITFSDGVTDNWSECSPVDDDADPWEALRLMDAWIMSADVKKTVSDKNREHFMYDQECLDACDAILNNR